MIDLIKIISSDYYFEVIDHVQKNPGINAFNLTKAVKIHIVTAQRILDCLEKYGFIKTEEKKGIGRPSKLYTYVGGQFQVNLDELLKTYQNRLKVIRETGNPEVSFNYDIDKELVNAVLIKGKSGKKIRINEKMGKLLWLIPPPDSKGEKIEKLAIQANTPIVDAIIFINEMVSIGIVEEVTQ